MHKRFGLVAVLSTFMLVGAGAGSTGSGSSGSCEESFEEGSCSPCRHGFLSHRYTGQCCQYGMEGCQKCEGYTEYEFPTQSPCHTEYALGGCGYHASCPPPSLQSDDLEKKVLAAVDAGNAKLLRRLVSDNVDRFVYNGLRSTIQLLNCRGRVAVQVVLRQQEVVAVREAVNATLVLAD